MNDATRLLAGFFRQQAELGGQDLYLSALSPAEARAALSTAAGSPARARARAAARSAPAAPPPARGAVAAPPVPKRAVAPRRAPDVATLRVLADEAAKCTRCGLHAMRGKSVFGEGDQGAEVVVVGEAPGGAEDRTGRPFVGRAGQLLDLLLMSSGLPREAVYICNLLKCRPPDNRDPQPDEVAACTGAFLVRQLEAISPRVLLALGRHATQFLTGSTAPVGRLRGTVQNWRGVPVVVTYHPSYLLRSPQAVRVAWEDVQLVRKIIDE